MAKAKKGGKKALYQTPEPVPKGSIFKDVFKQCWYIDSTIGKGGFGEIYAACKAGEEQQKIFSYAVKLEPFENGPLFLEQAFFTKYLKPDHLAEWKKSNKLKHLGLPSFQGFGNHELKGKKHRFLVMERFGKDLWSLFLENSRTFDNKVIVNASLQMVDVLHYIHSKGYVHGDIKGANILSCLDKKQADNLVLVDFGLAEKYSTLEEFRKNPKRANNGTIEYTSTDMHLGVPTRRSDLEILGYNIAHWAMSILPWEKYLNVPDRVFQMKLELMDSLRKGSHCGLDLPKYVIAYLTYVARLGHLEEPDYAHCKSILRAGLKETPVLKLTSPPDESKTARPPVKKKLKSLKVLPDAGENADFNDIKENCDEMNMNSLRPRRRVSARLSTASKRSIDESPSEEVATNSNTRRNWRLAPAVIAGRSDKPGTLRPRSKN